MTQADGGRPPRDHTVTLTVPSDPKYTRLVRALVAAAAETIGFARDEVNGLCLAVDEACTNVIRHAYLGETTHSMEVRLGIHADRLDVTLRDWGRKVDPASIHPRELSDIRPGGLGVHFIREIMDEVVYDPTPATGTELRMSKKLKPRQGAE